MRLIGHLETEELAKGLSDFLFVKGIENQVDREAERAWAVWVHSEDRIQEARGWLEQYRQNPKASQFEVKAAQAEKLRKQQAKEDAAYAKKIKDRREVFRPMAFAGFGPLTMALIGISVLIAVLRLTSAGDLFVSRYLCFSEAQTGMPEILHGQLWRLITPVLVHASLLGSFGFLHLLFNMLWLRDLGGMIELRQGTAKLAVLVLGLAILSNATQYFSRSFLLQVAVSGGPPALTHSLRLIAEALGGPGFFGMSGVNYGLFGYIWTRGRFDPGSGLFLHPQTVGIMLVWFVLCFTPFVSNVANAAHLGGLVAGVLWGWAASLRYR